MMLSLITSCLLLISFQPLKWSYDKQNLTIMVISHESYEIPQPLFHKFQMK